MSVTLTPELEALIEELLATGRYADAGEVIEQAVRQLEERERGLRLRASVAEGFATIQRGEGVELTPELWQEFEREADEADRQGLPINPDAGLYQSRDFAVVEQGARADSLIRPTHSLPSAGREPVVSANW